MTPDAGVHEVPAAVAAPPGNPRFSECDGLRGLGFLTVLVHHVGIATNYNVEGRFADVTAHLKFGVPLFFMLSGFLLYRPIVNARVSGRPFSFRSFYWRRAIRIFPPFWLALVLIGSIPAFTEAQPNYGDILSRNAPFHFGLLQVYNPDTLFTGLTHAWTLCVDLAFYVALVGFLVLGKRSWEKRRTHNREIWVLIALAILSLALREYVGRAFERPHGYIWIEVTLLTTFTWFAVGMGLAILTVSESRTMPRLTSGVLWLGSRPALCWGIAGLAYIALMLGNHESLSLLTVATLLFLPTVVDRDGLGPTQRLLRTRVMAWLGLVSYGLYLWHLPLIFLLIYLLPVAWTSSFSVLLGLTFVATVAVAAASYYLVEEPLLRLKRPRLRPQAQDVRS